MEHLEEIELWAILDTSEKRGRFVYLGDEGKKIGAIAIYDKEPEIPEHWRQFKKVVKVRLTIAKK